MHKVVPFCVFMLMVLVGLTGCKSNKESEDMTQRDVLAEPVQILSSAQGPQCGIETAMVKLIQTPAELEKMNAPVLEELKVDFQKNDIVLATLGTCPTGGFAINITAIQKEGDTLYVEGSTTVPPADAMVTQALTQPYCAAVIPKTGATKVRSSID